MVKRTKSQKLMYYSRPNFYNKVLKELEETEEKVVWILAKHEETRNSDMHLLMKFWNDSDNWNGLFIEPYIRQITCAETIIRARRYIQNTLKLWLPTDPEVAVKRSIKEAAFKDWYSWKANMK